MMQRIRKFTVQTLARTLVLEFLQNPRTTDEQLALVAAQCGAEVTVLYHARWKIELLLKRWKSQGLLSELQGSTDTRQMIRFWSRFLALLVQHWLVVTRTWSDPRHSLSQACEVVRHFVSLLLASLDCSVRLRFSIDILCRTVRSTVRQNKRSNPITFQILNDLSPSNWSLT